MCQASPHLVCMCVQYTTGLTGLKVYLIIGHKLWKDLRSAEEIWLSQV